jgi:integrase
MPTPLQAEVGTRVAGECTGESWPTSAALRSGSAVRHDQVNLGGFGAGGGRCARGSRRPLQRGQAWLIVKQASERARVQVLALRASKHGRPGDPAPVHPHIFRHARVRQIVRATRHLPLAQRQAGWSRLQMAYLTVGDDEARRLMQELTE